MLEIGSLLGFASAEKPNLLSSRQVFLFFFYYSYLLVDSSIVWLLSMIGQECIDPL